LHRVGMLLTDTFRRYDVIGRFGGDEFVILLKGVASEAILNERCRNIQNNLRSVSSAVSGMEITGSFGVILVKDQKVELQSLFDQADRALYEAKRSGRATFAIQEYLTERH
ncbi:MAG TPA: GGDEF domain-containing protein, partial [Candidatus Scatomonas merdavium]|nr:GGDEF domain-containing protein [Candidatus Scatomonas merdavium]